MSWSGPGWLLKASVYANAVLGPFFSLLTWWLSGPSVHILAAEMLAHHLQRRLFHLSVAPGPKSTSAGHSRPELFMLLGVD